MSILGTFYMPHPPIMIPQIGRGDEVKLQKTIEAYEQVVDKIAELKPDTIVVISNKAPRYSDYIQTFSKVRLSGNLSKYGAKEIDFTADFDIKYSKKIREIAERTNYTCGGTARSDFREIDYGTIIPLYYITKRYVEFNLVSVGLSDLPECEHAKMGEIIAQAADELDRKVVCIASCDLSENPSNKDFTNAYAMLEGVNGSKVDFTESLINFEDPFNVGYAVGSLSDTEFVKTTRKKLEVDNGAEAENNAKTFETLLAAKKVVADKKLPTDQCVKLAQLAVETFIQTNDILLPNKVLDETSELLNERRPVFVTLYKNGNLRGCIGATSAIQKTVADEIIGNAVSAATRDVRFMPITSAELREIEYQIDILNDPTDVKNIDELDCSQYGLIMEKDNKKSIILPNLAGVETVDMQLLILRKQLGITEDDKDFTLKKFTVETHK